MQSALRRRDRTAMTGDLLHWPVHLDSYGGNGTSVYALWPERDPEPLVACHRGLDLHVQLIEELLGDPTGHHAAFPRINDSDLEVSLRSGPLLGALMLGTTGASWALRDPAAATGTPMSEAFCGLWTATEGDLTDTGRMIITTLSATYGRPAVLATLQDT